ncbi:Probable nitroreductase [Mycobacteroides abscessus]|nr:Probable nitroreductase [Mycobacteroides abscessus]
MELYDVMRTTFAAREFTRDPLPDKVLDRILDNARFAPSGGNRQAGHVIVVKARPRGRVWSRRRSRARAVISPRS